MTMTKFRRLSITHAAMMGGDAAMLLALADSLFLSIDPSAARSRVLLFLVVSFAPFVVIAPLIGPAIDRVAGGRRLVIQLVGLARIGLALAMAVSLDHLVLFPLVFAALVLQKAYIISKSALVPTVVRTERDLVEANSKLGVIAGLAGAVAIVPAALLQFIGPLKGWATLLYSAALFGVAVVNARRLPAEAILVGPEPRFERVQLHSPRVQSAAISMALLRAAVGFLFFHLAFWLRSVSSGTFWFGVGVSAAAFGTMTGNVLAPRIRNRITEERMLSGALVVATAAGVVAAIVGGTMAAVALAGVLNMAAALGRLAFESILQRDAPDANRGRAFAQFEARFQLSWAVAGVLPVLVAWPGQVGFLIVGLICLAAATPVLRFVGDRVVPAVRRRTS